MLKQVHASAVMVIREQTAGDRGYRSIVTGLAAVLGFIFAMMVSSGITGPVLPLLAGTREVEAGRARPVDQRDNATTKSVSSRRHSTAWSNGCGRISEFRRHSAATSIPGSSPA